MRGARRLRLVRPIGVPSWDSSVILEGLMVAPFEHLESAPERILTLKVTILLALTSLKRVGDLQALSVSEICMDFAPGLVKVTLRPRLGYIPKVLSTSFRSQVVTLTLSRLLPLLQARMKGFTCSVLSKLWRSMWKVQPLEEISPVVGMFWCWPPWACHIEAQNFSLGEGCYFAGLWGVYSFFSSQHLGSRWCVRQYKEAM